MKLNSEVEVRDDQVHFLKDYSVYTIENGLVQTITRLLSRQKVMNRDSCGVGEEWTGL